jgi:AcrR family transcriptional regulator
MLCKPRTRARRSEDKQQRQHDILAAALRLFDQRPYAAIRMDDIAREAGLAKGTLYLYFATKEEVFLALESIEIGEWLGQATALFASIEGRVSPELLVKGFIAGIVTRPRLLKLLALLHAVLEQNASGESILRFKRGLMQHFERAAPLLEQRLGLDASVGLRLLMQLYALLIGLWQIAVPAPAVQAVLEANADLALFRMDFAAEFEHAALALLRGWQAEN